MKKLKLVLLIGAGALAASQASANMNLLVNGDFSQPDVGGWWGTFDSIPGWTPVPDASVGNVVNPIEIGTATIYGVTGFGTQITELDSIANDAMAQSITLPAGTYTLSLQYALRAGVAQDSGTFSVQWNGIDWDFHPTSSTATTWTETVTGAGNLNTLVLEGTGLSDSYGAIIGNVSLVPEPTTVVAGAMLLLPFGMSTLRMFRKSRTA